jgi:hypothetical protein
VQLVIMHLHNLTIFTPPTDHRAPPPAGRIPDPSDILASVLVSGSKIQPGTYQAMPTYRLCSTDGVCVLTDESMVEVKRAVEGLHHGEAEE